MYARPATDLVTTRYARNARQFSTIREAIAYGPGQFGKDHWPVSVNVEPVAKVAPELALRTILVIADVFCQSPP